MALQVSIQSCSFAIKDSNCNVVSFNNFIIQFIGLVYSNSRKHTTCLFHCKVPLEKKTLKTAAGRFLV